MLNSYKIINDPVHGFINIPKGLILELIDHPFFQRLSRIKQMGLSHFVYPGAMHSRLNHALGALYLMQSCILVLKSKGIKISRDEEEAVYIAILLHDIGHGPFSHALENCLIDISHEEISLAFMKALNDEFEGQLSLAIDIFRNKYPRKFLHQLVSSQLDMDRMDYLTRDSFFSGVVEGVIGHDRIIKMINVVDDQMVVEEKGLYSIEKFLIARRFMYRQVYLHKTALAAEKMLLIYFYNLRTLAKTNQFTSNSASLQHFLVSDIGRQEFAKHTNHYLTMFNDLDDFDIINCVKTTKDHPDFICRFLSDGLINRQLFKTKFSDDKPSKKYLNALITKIAAQYDITLDIAAKLLMSGLEKNKTYNPHISKEIIIQRKSGELVPVSVLSEIFPLSLDLAKYYIVHPNIKLEE